MHKKRFSWVLDYMVPALVALIGTLQLNCAHGLVDMWETAVYTPFINEVFHHKILYKDVMIFRGPLEIYLPALLMRLAGVHLATLYFWFYIGNALTIVVSVLMARELLRTRFFHYLLIPVIIAFCFSQYYFKMWGGFRYACGFTAVWCLLRFFSGERRGWLLGAGILSGLGLFFSIDMGLFPFLTVCAGLFTYRKEIPFWKNFLWYCAGCALIVVPFLVYLISSGGLPGYIQNILVVPRSGQTVYHFEIVFPEMPQSPLQVFRCALQPFTPEFLYFVPVVVYFFAGIYLLRKRMSNIPPRAWSALVSMFVFGILLYYGSFRQINGPQFLIALQLAVIFSFVLFESVFLWSRQKSGGARSNRPVAVLRIVLYSVIFWLTFTSIFKVKNFFVYGWDLKRVAFRQINRGDFPSGSTPKPLTIERGKGLLLPDWQADEINGVVDYIRAKTSPGEEVLTVPDQSAYNFLADRPCVSRFCQIDIASYRPDWQEEFRNALNKNKPRYVIARREEDCFEPLLKGYPLVQNRQEARDFIKRYYVREISFGRIDIYRRADIKI